MVFFFMVMVKVEKYMKLHRELLGSYDPLHLPARPSQEALERMRGGNLSEKTQSTQIPGTVQDFLQREGLASLAPLLQLYTFLNGFG